jgi:hypothetical protein
MEFREELISEMGYKNAVSNFHIGNRDRDKKKTSCPNLTPNERGHAQYT